MSAATLTVSELACGDLAPVRLDTMQSRLVEALRSLEISIEDLQRAAERASAVESLVILPMISRAVDTKQQLAALIAARADE